MIRLVCFKSACYIHPSSSTSFQQGALIGRKDIIPTRGGGRGGGVMRLGREPDDDEAERGEDRRRGGVDRWVDCFIKCA